MAITAQSPYQFFTETDGTALESGKIYVGTAGLDAESNQISVYWDSDLTVAAAQPIRTIAGVPDRSGTPSDFFVSGDYSITVNDVNDVFVYSKSSLNENDPAIQPQKTFDTLADLLLDTTITTSNTSAGDIIEAQGWRYNVVTSNAHFTNANGVGFQHVDGAYVTVIMGQSNAEGANSGGPNPASSLVKAWDAVTGAWGSSDYTQAPWTHSNPNGNGANNNIALARAHRIADSLGRLSLVIYSAYGGTSIDAWVGAGTSSYAWVDIEAKIAAAFATPELAGKTTVDEVIWVQGEADYEDTFGTHLDNLILLRNQYRNSVWCNWETPIYMLEPSNQHERYQAGDAIAYMCGNVDNYCIFVPTNGLRTSYDPQGDGSVIVPGGDYTHWLGPSLFEAGYHRIANVAISKSAPAVLYGRGTGGATPADAHVVSAFNSLTSWNSRTGGIGLKETFTGDGVTNTFEMDYRGTNISEVTLDGVVQVDPTDYSKVANSLVFVVTPPLAATVIVTYAASVNAPPSTDSISWGYACYADGNFTQAFGAKCRTDNFSNYGMLVGNTLETKNGAKFFFGVGWLNNIHASYGVVFGTGNEVYDEGQLALGFYAEYAAVEADPVLFQVGIGTSTSARNNALTVRKSGEIEAKHLPVYATNADAVTGGLAVGTIFQTPGGALRIVV